jgi:hypothetical protein
MEQRGLSDVAARTNERVYWIAPPYHSRDQRVAYQNIRERLKEKGRRRLEGQERQQLRAGGVTARLRDECLRLRRNANRRFRRAITGGAAAFAWSGPFWCVWGFKPTK